MHFITLIMQAHQGSSHTDNVVIGMGRKNQTSFGMQIATLGMIGNNGIGFTGRPSRDYVFQQIKYLQINFIRISFLNQ